MLSKSLIQFSVYGWSCVPSLLLTWGQTMVEVPYIHMYVYIFVCIYTHKLFKNLGANLKRNS